MNITIVGAGYVGMGLAVVLAKKNNVFIIDIDKRKVEKINNKNIVYGEQLMNDLLGSVSIKAVSYFDEKIIKDTNMFFICVPTNLINNNLDVSIVNDTIDKIHKYKKNAFIIIKSTIPIGTTSKLNVKYSKATIIFSPEFSREGFSAYDIINPDRIIVGSDFNNDNIQSYISLMSSIVKNKSVPVKVMGTREAEMVKLFANAYLALRVSFFNEVDSFSLLNHLKSVDIIDALCLDNRIGNLYNNPSFGFGGYCLPKDVKQVETLCGAKFPLLSNITNSNNFRKNLIAEYISTHDVKTIGIYSLAMKKNSDNSRNSAIFDIIQNLKQTYKIIVYEENMHINNFLDKYEIENNLENFKNYTDLILSNRWDDNLKDVKEKVISRDLYGNN